MDRARAMKLLKFDNQFDRGSLRLQGQNIADRSYAACGLSLGAKARSEFRECSFSNIKIRKCSVGFPIFDRCRFKDITSDLDGVLVYGAGFRECIFSGLLKNVVIGFSAELVGLMPEDAKHAQRLQAENLRLAADGKFAIDVTEADLEWVAFQGEAIIPFVRCARYQALILRANDLHAKLVQLGRSQAIRAISNFFLSTGVVPGVSAGIAVFNPDQREHASTIELDLRDAGIDVSHFD
jgi:hypothetical protein